MVLAGMIVPAHDVRRSLPGGSAVSELAALEYRRDELAWIAAQARDAPVAVRGDRSLGARLRRWLGSPRETERDGETIAEPGPA